MLSVHLNSLHLKKPLSADCKVQVILANHNQNSVRSEIVEYSKKDNIALFSENLFLKDIRKQLNSEDLAYYIIELYEKYPQDKIIASKTFTPNDILGKNKVSLKTIDGNELTLHLKFELFNQDNKTINAFNKQNSMTNQLDDLSIGAQDSYFGSPLNQRSIEQIVNNQNESKSSQNSKRLSPPLNAQNASSKENEGGEQFFNAIANQIKNGFLSLCEKNPETDLDYLDINEYTIRFVSKLGPVVAISNYLREVYKWTNIFQTMMFGISTSLIIFYPKAIILFSLLYTYIFTKRVIQIMFQLGIKKPEKVNIIDKNVNKMKNLKRNMIFLQEQMRFYSQVYDQVCEFLYSDDKTQVVKNIQLFRNYSIFLVMGMIFIPFDVILFSSFWFSLISQNFYGKIISKEILTLIHKLAVRVNHFLDNEIIIKYLPKSVVDALPIPEKNSGLQKIVKKFIIQENQRWWLGKGWADILIPGDIPKWSDIQGLRELKKEDFKLPDKNWQWENEGQWQVQLSEDTDLEGWQYGKSFSDTTFINQQKSLYYIRKRVWYKTCSCLVSYYYGEENEQDTDDTYILQK
ncbi:transmembrane protein, putative (macronuclear) [Tetrahymena thermophila SB210]|uniref:Transmembrane protein, putative n=1 Tax=Tetrahymena thermophila (strain SB210) TaxID=312017 RepID=I7M2B3_TETTS|nr:transmembrane protein, putative [Tetrahymena thermophila SB210]EAR99679.3 transmembrane protein, putative [Tetrahymena thermophila SB210]|eukprot:XP_001019924.3 transmembrane protein, putative [Tetrahymena thermophila SB210]